MASPVGEDDWVGYVDRQLHAAVDLETRAQVVETFSQAVAAEPGSLKVWMAYCEYFWSLYSDCQPGSDAGWPAEEQMIGRETFTLDAALSLWQQGYEAVQYRLSDSHELWNRWVSLEMELLSRTATDAGIRRITQLFRNRLGVPHATWDATAQMFSHFLSEYNPQAYESEMQQATHNSKEAKRLYALRNPFETQLNAAIKSGDSEQVKAQVKTVMTEYLEWEIRQTKLKKDPVTNFRICLGLFARALTGMLAKDGDTWKNYVVMISTCHSDVKAGRSKIPANLVPNMLDVLQSAVHHVPWCGPIWARYILSAEEAGLSFTDIERIKHAATNSDQLDHGGMEGVLEMYSAWCGYLKRTAMNPNATEEAVDLAEVGLPTALEDVKHWGERRNAKHGPEYQGDHTFRLEKILIQFLTEKKEDIDGARAVWESLSDKDIHATSYDFWLNWFLWEMVVFGSEKNKTRSPTPVTLAQGLRVPSYATRVFHKALKVRDMDWPERILDVYLKHCNDYELAETLREAQDTVYKTKKGIAKRRDRENAQRYAQQQAEYAAQVQLQAQVQAQDEVMADAPGADAPDTDATPNGDSGKRKREPTPSKDDDLASKRTRNEAVNGTETETKRDRENTSVFVRNLPIDVTLTQVRQFFRGYGHINNVDLKREPGSPSVAHVEFSTPEDRKTALIRDGKKIRDGEEPVQVTPATDCTLFVTNYPPEFTEQDIRDLFKACGEIHSVRFPSLIANAARRFCYVTFRDRTFAEAGTKLDGKFLQGGNYKLLAKYSDPPKRGARHGPMAEGRELHVVNLPRMWSETDISGAFAKAGKVISVRLLRSNQGLSRGSAFVVMETKEEAQKAEQLLDGAKFGDRMIKVEPSKAPGQRTSVTSHAIDNEGSPKSMDSPAGTGSGTAGSPPPASSAGDHSESESDVARRTVAFIGVPDTMNDAQLRRLLAPIAPIDKLILHPKHRGAILRMKDAGAAGKAALFVNGLEIPGSGGRKLQTTSTDNLFNQTSEIRIDRIDQPAQHGETPSEKKKAPTAAELMPPPPRILKPATNVGRPGRPPLGRGGARKGLGFTGAIHKKVIPTPNGSSDGPTSTANGVAGVPSSGTNGDVTAPSGGKSNEDFKKMFLKGGSDAVKNGVKEEAKQ